MNAGDYVAKVTAERCAEINREKAIEAQRILDRQRAIDDIKDAIREGIESLRKYCERIDDCYNGFALRLAESKQSVLVRITISDNDSKTTRIAYYSPGYDRSDSYLYRDPASTLTFAEAFGTYFGRIIASNIK